jgi:hypothetical protein
MEFCAETVHARPAFANTDILDTGLWLRDYDRVLLAIASFIIQYLDWQAGSRFCGRFVRNGGYSLRWIAATKCAQRHSRSWGVFRFQLRIRKEADCRIELWADLAYDITPAIKAIRVNPIGPQHSEMNKTKSKSTHPGQASTVRKICALTNLDDISVRIADVAADLAVLGQRLRDELGSSTFP